MPSGVWQFEPIHIKFHYIWWNISYNQYHSSKSWKMKILLSFSLDHYSAQIPGPEGLFQMLSLIQKLVCYLLFQYDNTAIKRMTISFKVSIEKWYHVTFFKIRASESCIFCICPHSPPPPHTYTTGGQIQGLGLVLTRQPPYHWDRSTAPPPAHVCGGGVGLILII